LGTDEVTTTVTWLVGVADVLLRLFVVEGHGEPGDTYNAYVKDVGVGALHTE